MSVKTLKKYEMVINSIVEKIYCGEYTPHQKLPSEKELLDLYEVSEITIKRAMKELADNGFIYRIKGKGSFIRDESIKIKTSLKVYVMALIMSDSQVHNSSFINIIRGIQKNVSDKGHFLLVEYADGSIRHEKEVLMKVLQRRVDGLLLYLNNVEIINEIMFKEDRLNVPFVLLDRWDPRYPCDLVAPNNEDAAYNATEYLIRAGHRNIAFAAHHFELISEQIRYSGYRKALANYGITESALINSLDDITYQQICSLIKADVTAVFCVNDRVALHLLSVLDENKIPVPDRISIVGFDDFEPVQYASVPLTTVRQNFEELGMEAARILLHNIKSGVYNSHKKIFISTEIVERKSVKRFK